MPAAFCLAMFTFSNPEPRYKSTLQTPLHWLAIFKVMMEVDDHINNFRWLHLVPTLYMVGQVFRQLGVDCEIGLLSGGISALDFFSCNPKTKMLHV